MSPSTTTNTKFRVLEDTLPDDHSLPAFMVSTTRGFLPRQEPVVDLPPEFSPLEQILSSMPILTASGRPGLLAEGKLGGVVDTSFPNLTNEIDRYAHDQPLMNGLYRDYSFLASAYLLEPCHKRWEETDGKEYGLGRDLLPRCIAEPMVRVAELTGFQPFMEYAGSYALYNYRLLNPALGLDYDNLSLIRAFERGLDPKSSEAGFVLVHVDMVKHSHGLVSGAVSTLKSLTSHSFSALEQRTSFNVGLTQVITSMQKVNKVMDGMWSKSRPGAYTSFRTFIFGITSQSMFPNGVIYEGVSDEPLSFRGESGANDSMVPLVDNLCQIPMPDTPLTVILKDFRKYRPGNHRAFLEYVQEAAKGEDGMGVRRFAMGDKISASLYLLVLDQVREFRFRHWTFTRDYILRRTKHPRATGGSPIVQWLPNQLFAVMDLMQNVIDNISSLKNKDPEDKELAGRVAEVTKIVLEQRVILDAEVKKYMNDENRGQDMHVRED